MKHSPLVRQIFAPLALLLAIACGGNGNSPAARSSPSPSASASASAASPSASASPASNLITGTLIGQGYTDVSPHQVVRTSSNVLYVIAPTCNSYPSCPANSLPVYAGNQPGIPTSFTQVDDTQQAAGANDSIGSSAIAIDGNDLVWVAWYQRGYGGTTYIDSFDTRTNAWGTITVLQTNNGYPDFSQGTEGVAVAVDAANTAHVVWTGADSSGTLHTYYANSTSGFSAPFQVDDYTLAPNHGAIHPALAFAPDGSLVVAWLDGYGNYLEPPNGTIHVRTRTPSGSWNASVEINDQAMTSIDQGPSLLVTSDGTRHIAFNNGSDIVRYWYSSDGATWQGNEKTPKNQNIQNPSLGPDGTGGISLYGPGPPTPTIQSDGLNLYRYHKAVGSTTWGPWTQYVSGDYDSSVSTRWAQFHQNFPAQVDAVYWSPVTAT